MMTVEDYRAIPGAQKAAILMLALGEEQCARLFALMHEDEIRDVSTAMSQLGPVRAEVVERLCHDFTRNMGNAGSLVGSFENTERLLQRSPAARPRGADHGGDPRSRRAHHVGQARQRERGGAGRTISRTNTRRPSPWCCRR